MAANWLARDGHGGFYRAMADGTCEEYGLDVEIMMGGPQMNNRPMLPAGRVDFHTTGNLPLSFDNVRNDIPTVVAAAFFQKDPQALLANQGVHDGFAGLNQAPTVPISKVGQFGFWRWMVAEHGFRDERLRPYGYNQAQFQSDTPIVQQGYAAAKPLYAAAAGAMVDTCLFGGPRLEHGFHDPQGSLGPRRAKTRSCAKIRQCLNRGLVQLHLRRPHPGLRGDHGAQHGSDR